MIRFNSDYTEGAHPAILERLAETNFVQTNGYGEDEYCFQAKQTIKKVCNKENADVHFLVGGSQTNLTVISSALRPYQSVLSPVSGHIFVHETGAIEATGHKVEALPSTDGKITASQIEEKYLSHIHDESFEHMTQPKMVYISNSTELGTIYTRAELKEISDVCRQYDLYLYMDGARLGYALTCDENDLDLPFIADCCDVFYIGGTKQGALFGEAVVITRDELKKDFRYMIKQKGGMLAKGRLLGLQFQVLFEDNLYFQLARHANETAAFLRKAISDAGYSFLIPSPTNQQFPIFPNDLLTKLQEKYAYSNSQQIDKNHRAIRLCTSWATKWEDVKQLARDIEGYNE
ncbi:MAG TPA: low specificity L-threonine aldolase [Flexilinea sp.]|nr:low specificity L-threonine aldolase [Flexilinea sp.]